MLKLMFYEVPARDRQHQRSCRLVTRVPYCWRHADWYAYRLPKLRHRWHTWDKSEEIQPTDDLVREMRLRRCKQ